MSSDAPLLSAILIVKNEEKRLARCLEPLQKTGCEIIVIDTGSEDRTVEIARGFGAIVDFFPWNGDEAAARNVSLKKAQGKWVFWVDADEIVDERLIQSIREDLPTWDREEKVQTLSVVMKNVYQGDSSSLTPLMRFARRREDLRFDGVIHPQLNFRQSCESLKGILLHEGYQWTPETRKKKSAHMRAHLEPLCLEEKPPFNRWCEFLSVLLIGDDRDGFDQNWKKRLNYSEGERYQGPFAHYWQDNTTNVLLFFSRYERDEEGVELARELLLHYPDQIAPRFYLLQNALKRRQWSELHDQILQFEEIIAKPLSFYNTFYPEIHGEMAHLWSGLTQFHLDTSKVGDFPEAKHPRHGASWIYAVLHFGDRLRFSNKWQQALARLIQEGQSEGKSPEVLLLALEKIIPLLEKSSMECCVALLFEVILRSRIHSSSLEFLKKLDEFVNQYPDLTWVGMGLEKMQPQKPILAEWFYEEGLHRV